MFSKSRCKTGIKQNSTQGVVTEFYQQQHKALLRFLYRKLGSFAEATDVAQQTYERLLKTQHLQNITNPRAFIYRTATNLAIDIIRKRKRVEEVDMLESDELEMLCTDEASPDQRVYMLQTLDLVRAFIAELPPKCRYAFLSYKFEECDYAEIAESLGVSESMVRKYVLRAIAYCRDRLEQYEVHGGRLVFDKNGELYDYRNQVVKQI